jgi:hypothetical protein
VTKVKLTLEDKHHAIERFRGMRDINAINIRRIKDEINKSVLYTYRTNKQMHSYKYAESRTVFHHVIQGHGTLTVQK